MQCVGRHGRCSEKVGGYVQRAAKDLHSVYRPLCRIISAPTVRTNRSDPRPRGTRR